MTGVLGSLPLVGAGVRSVPRASAGSGSRIRRAGYRVIDRLTPEVDFPAELQKGNVAVAIFIAAIFLSIALIIGKALG